MELKGGIAFINMKGSIIENDIALADSVYVKDIYKYASKAVKAGKVVVIYNCGGGLKNISFVSTAYNTLPSNIIVFKISIVKGSGAVSDKRLYIKPDNTYAIIS